MKIRRGDILYVDLGVQYQGSIQGSMRPVVVVSNNMANKHSTVITVVPLSTKINKKRNLPTHVFVSAYKSEGLEQHSIALCEQVTALDYGRIIENMGTMKKTWMPLYEQYTDGKLSREDFLVEKKKYDEETTRLEQRLYELQSRQEIQQESNQQIEKNISQLNCYVDQMELTEEIKEKLIDKVNVYSDNRIEICWNFDSGFFDLETMHKCG